MVSYSTLPELIASISDVDDAVAADARARHRQLTKPPDSLGRIEALGVQLAAIAGAVVPPVPAPAAAAVFAGDHGVHAEGVSPWPQEVTAQMVANFCAGGAAINVIARANDISVTVVNVGVAIRIDDHPMLRNVPIRAGTRNLRTEAALTADEVIEAILVGAGTAEDLLTDGARCLITGDMGIANTTPSAALISAATGVPAAEITGRGTGIDDATLARKRRIVIEAVERAGDVKGVELLAELGGLEIAALTGFCLAGAAARVPVIVDGVIALAGAIVAAQLQPLVTRYLIGGHRSVEPAAAAALDALGLDPLLDLDLRLGEGTGAALAYPLVRAAAEILAGMATFDDAGVKQSE